MKLRLATRGSKLALTQSRWVAAQLEQLHKALRVEIVEIKTTGDVKLGQSLQAIGGKGAFTKELEDALLENRADLAVHSLKDLPTQLPDGLVLGCTPQREEVNDVLILREKQPGNELTEDPFKLLRSGVTVGTSSLRRRAQLKALRPDLNIIEFRGNVDSRLRKLQDGKAEATLLALAGLKRLGLLDAKHHLQDQFGVFVLPVRHWLPAVSQGCLGIEIRDVDKRVRELLAPLHDAGTFAAVSAERAFLNALGAGCTSPVGALAEVPEGSEIILLGALFAEDGTSQRRAQARGHISAPGELGEAVAAQILKAAPAVHRES